MSAHSKKTYKQGCKDCNRYFLPSYLWQNSNKRDKQDKKELNDNHKPHLSSLCEACKKGVCKL